MSLVLNATPQSASGPASATAAVRVTLQGRSAAVLIAELDGASACSWEASRNRAFWAAVQRDGTAANAVVIVPPGSLPRRAGGAVEQVAVIEDFAKRRGYLRDELQAWVVNRLCEVLYLAPVELDPKLDWARHGVDSAVALELVADLEDKLRLKLPQALAECGNPGELAAEATARLLDAEDRLPWWRSPWVVTEGV